MKSYSKQDYRQMLWKNGGGTTTELFRYPIDQPFVLRLSCAEVKEDGPFSLYEGHDRHLLITSGEGCVLKTSAHTKTLKVNDPPFFFAGEENIFCELIQGPVKDFNVMINRNWGEASVEVMKHNQGEIELHCSGDLLLAYNFDDETLLELAPGDVVTLYSNDLVTVEIKKKAG